MAIKMIDMIMPSCDSLFREREIFHLSLLIDLLSELRNDLMLAGQAYVDENPSAGGLGRWGLDFSAPLRIRQVTIDSQFIKNLYLQNYRGVCWG